MLFLISIEWGRDKSLIVFFLILLIWLRKDYFFLLNVFGNYDKNVNYSNKFSEGIDLCVYICDKNFI